MIIYLQHLELNQKKTIEASENKMVNSQEAVQTQESDQQEVAIKTKTPFSTKDSIPILAPLVNSQTNTATIYDQKYKIITALVFGGLFVYMVMKN